MSGEGIGILIGVFVGSVITFLVNYLRMRHEDKFDKRKTLIARLEEAYEISEKITGAANLMNINAIFKLVFGVDYENRPPGKIPVLCAGTNQ